MGYKIKDIAELNSSSLSDKEKIDVIQYLDTGNITRGFIAEIATLIKGADKIPSRAKRKVKEGDIIYSTVRPNQEHFGFIDKDSANLIVSTGFTVISVKKEIVNPYFLYCYLTQKKITEYLQGIAENSTTTYPSIKAQDIGDLDIELPSREVQNFIAQFILNINNKISLNIDIINNLEETSNLLFKNWFIDFEFPNEQGLPYRSSGGGMVESELGEVPIGWESVHLSSISEFLSGGTPKTKEESYWNGDIPFFTPKDVGSSLYCSDTEKHITELGLNKCNSRLYPKNTIFITARGTVGKMALANRDMAMNQSCFALKHKQDKQFYLLGVISKLLREIVQGANGAVFNAINLGDLNCLKITKAPDSIVMKYEEIVLPLFEKMSQLEFENIKLTKLRDTLLPKLLSGEIEIPDESVVES
ncbi:restriction endonuclease subunit S [Lysinibacillus capsici]|uniref:restriction endonuclease subunit S n=1 Tax=Lysinibacillus TaxID=400634 RepID=UPI0025841606|nr:MULTISPECIES: restriction endonuclease subunit S [Lysinibacillus]WPK04622.1 restriction endonuclease subunit S [Lysinibacillus capsici]